MRCRRYDALVARVRSFLKNEIHRILNLVLHLRKPHEIVIESLDFRSPTLMPQPCRREHDGYLHNYQRSGISRVIGIGREVQGQHKLGGTFPITLTMSVNVSARQFHHPQFVSQVLAAVTETGANPSRLKLELTESMLVNDVEDVIDKMARLKAHGVTFSLNDFGTGFSSLSYHKWLPLDQIKIDQSFVRDVLTNPHDAVIARTVVALAHNLDLSVIAEGVETIGQRNFLEQNGCCAFQGYLFSRPLTAEQFDQYLRTTVPSDVPI